MQTPSILYLISFTTDGVTFVSAASPWLHSARPWSRSGPMIFLVEADRDVLGGVVRAAHVDAEQSVGLVRINSPGSICNPSCTCRGKVSARVHAWPFKSCGLSDKLATQCILTAARRPQAHLKSHCTLKGAADFSSSLAKSCVQPSLSTESVRGLLHRTHLHTEICTKEKKNQKIYLRRETYKI